MTHNLIVSNDKDADVVQFDITIPDNYSSFKVEYLNGSIINQNYLNVGDELQFTFSNHPIVYDVKAPNVVLNRKTGSGMKRKNDNVKYDKISLDMWQTFRVKYIPIYMFFDESINAYRYIFSPCKTNDAGDDRLYLDEPTQDVPSYKIYVGAVGNPVEAAFTGQFVLALEKEDNLPKTIVKIGESISNSKLQMNELGAYSVLGSNVSEVNEEQQLRTSAYSYGSSWTYPVDNLLMKHHLTIYESPTQDLPLVITESVADENDVIQYTFNQPLANYPIVNSEIQTTSVSVYEGTNKTLFKVQEYDSLNEPHLKPLTTNYKIFSKGKQNVLLNLFVKIQDSPLEYRNVLYDEAVVVPVDNISNGFLKSGQELVSEDFYDYNISFNKINYSYIDPDVKYSGNPLVLRVEWQPNGSEWVSAATEELYIYDNNHEYLKTPHLCNCRSTSTFKVVKQEHISDPDPPQFNARFKVLNHVIESNEDDETDINGEFVFADISFYVCGLIHPNETGNWSIISTLNTGLFKDSANPENWLIPITNSLLNVPLQLTSNDYPVGNDPNNNERELNEEDILLNVKDGSTLNFSFAQLKNNIHIINGNNISIKPLKWYWNDDFTSHANDQDLTVFVPCKTSTVMSRFKRTNYKRGFFTITTLDGGITSSLTDSNCNVFLAGGHETLNVEAPQSDDEKFKTFNGSLLFDRSDSKITRLFSNDITGSALGYINDILSAKLCRHYFIANYNTFNAFFDTSLTLPINPNSTTLNQYYTDFNLYSGAHEIVLCSCQDLVKLIGSENVVNNCFINLHPEQQRIDTKVMDFYDIINASTFKGDTSRQPFIYKSFHLYTASLDEEPYVGHRINDSNDTTIGGLNVLRVNGDTLNMGYNQAERHTTWTNSHKVYFIQNPELATDNIQDVKNEVSSVRPYNGNANINLGYIETLPFVRLYRNASFQQTDLTITTGGVKTLHPIYLQCVPRVLCQNVLYIMDFLINKLCAQYGGIRDSASIFNYVQCLSFQSNLTSLTTHPDRKYPLLRFGKRRKRLGAGGEQLIAESFDSLFILNYITPLSVNEFLSNEDLIDELPTKNNPNNEELIANVETSSQTMNVQLFSKKRFDFYDNIDESSVVIYRDMYVESIPDTEILFKFYFNFSNNKQGENDAAAEQNILTSLINRVSSYNNLKTCKLFIYKLGEFLQFPKILFGSCENFNNTLNVSVYNFNMSKMENPLISELKYDFDPNTDLQTTREETKTNDLSKFKVNTYLYGVMFKYHQLALGYNNLYNELQTDYQISKALGNRHFVLKLFDEYGRMIPNKDTSQGFSNNLYLEITLV